MTMTAKQIVEKMATRQAEFFNSVMARINAIEKADDMDDQLSCDIDNLPHDQQQQANAAIEKKAQELGLA